MPIKRRSLKERTEELEEKLDKLKTEKQIQELKEKLAKKRRRH